MNWTSLNQASLVDSWRVDCIGHSSSYPASSVAWSPRPLAVAAYCASHLATSWPGPVGRELADTDGVVDAQSYASSARDVWMSAGDVWLPDGTGRGPAPSLPLPLPATPG